MRYIFFRNWISLVINSGASRSCIIKNSGCSGCPFNWIRVPSKEGSKLRIEKIVIWLSLHQNPDRACRKITTLNSCLFNGDETKQAVLNDHARDLPRFIRAIHNRFSIIGPHVSKHLNSSGDKLPLNAIVQQLTN